MRLLAIILLLVCAVVPAFGEANPWTGTWVWNETPRKDNYFRKVFDARDVPGQAKIAITADNIYELYVNGKKIGVDDDWTKIEVYDISKEVRKGRNIIAVKATDPGADIGALLAECALTYADGSTQVLGSDKTWKMSGSVDAGWTRLDYDDSSWQFPREIGKPPAGVWGGLAHPTLLPKTPLKTISVMWPAEAIPGDTFTVTARVKPSVKIPVNSPVALQLTSSGDSVCEMWIDPDQPTGKWEPGKERTIIFKGFRLPTYVPAGRLQARVITTATDTTGAIDVQIGHPKPVSVARVAVTELNVTPVDNGELSVSAKVSGASRDTKWLFALYRGNELWLAKDVALQGVARIKLPEGLPGGSYTAKLLPHKAQCVKHPEVHIQISGASDTALKPLGYGTFVDRDGMPHRWYINKQGAMIWDGEPYVPVGAMYLSRFFGDFNVSNVKHNELTFEDDMKRLQMMKEAGITDLYLNPCHWWQERPAWVWQRFADMCEELGINYGIQLTNHVRPLRAYHIAQDEYRIPIRGGETARADIAELNVAYPDANSTVYYAAFDPESGEILDHGKAVVKFSENRVSVEATPKVAPGRDINVHFIPEFQFRAENDIHDYWQDIDLFKEWMVDFFPKFNLGPNFRLWIDPLDNEQSFRDADRLLPYSNEFRSSLAGYLKQKYGTIDKLSKGWAISGSKGLSDFEAFARLIPMGTPSKDSNTGYALNEKTGTVYKVDLAKSQMWHDMLRFRDSSIAEFNNEAAQELKKYWNVPVVLKGTDTDCFVNQRTYGGFDGLGMEAYGEAPELVRGCGGGVYARCKQANRTMWTLTTETGIAIDPCGYPDPMRLTKELGSMLEMNGKGTFYFLLSAAGGNPNEGWYIFNLFEDPRQLYWMGAYSKLVKSSKALPYYEPEVDYYFPGMIAGEQNGFACAVPSFKSDVPSQSVAGASGKWVVTTSTQVPVDAGRVIVNLEDTQATSLYGAEFEKLVKDRNVVVVGHRKNLGALSIDRYYTDKFVTDKSGDKVQALRPTPTSEVFAKTQDGTVYGLRDGSLTIYSDSDWLSSVREMAGEFAKPDFFGDVLGLTELDLGRAFQGLHFDSTTYVWNTQDKDSSLTLKLPDNARDVKITFADGRTETLAGPESVTLPLPANAAKPVIIQNLVSPTIEGVDGANLAAAMQQWVAATNRAQELGLETTVMPASSNWREIYAQADDLVKRADEEFNTTKAGRMSNVKADGDISEWQGVKPIFMKMDVGIDFAKAADYKDAKFYTGYDDNYLYIAGDVKDEKIANNYRLGGIWNGDAIEVFIDLQPEVDPYNRNYNSNCFQFLFAPTDKDGNPAAIIRSPGIPTDTVPANTLWAVKNTDAGWKFEAAIARSDIKGYKPEAGGKIGFTIQLDDSDGGDRTSEKLWRGAKGTSQNRLAFGRLVFR